MCSNFDRLVWHLAIQIYILRVWRKGIHLFVYPQDFTYGRLNTTVLDKQLTDGGEVVSLTRCPCLTPQEDSWYLFLLEGE
jgi:hypothetical protein